MRLTLRTLLAYLDNILEPASAQAMAAKIEESQTAADLVHRIRDVTKKVRLAAPTVDGKGMGLDANTVAEYLDNTLASESTPDFEMVCLESDVHLAEVAACHEILSLVLVQSADIDPATRQKMYTLLNQPVEHPTRAAAAHVPTAQTAPIAPVAMPVAAMAATVPASDGKDKRHVPEYLKGSVDEAAMARRGWMLAAAALLALMFVGGAFALAALPLDILPGFLHPLAKSMFGRETVVAQNDMPDPKPPRPTKPDDAPLPSLVIPIAVTTATGAPVLPVPIGTALTPPPLAMGTVPSPAVVAGTSDGLRQPPSAVVPSANVPPVPLGTAPVPPVPSTIGPNGALPAPVTATATATPPAVTLPAVTPPGVTPIPPVPGMILPPPIPPAAKIEPVGRVSSAGSQVLLRFDLQTGAWLRLPARETLSVGDRLLALPAYRPQISLLNGLTIEMLGGTLIELLPIDASGTPGVSLLRGRLMCFNVGGTRGSFRLENAKLQMLFSLTNAELGVEYDPRRGPGEEPTAAAPWGIMLFAKSGEITWASAAMPETPLAVPSQLLLLEDPAAAPTPLGGPQPIWLINDERDLLEKQAADFVELGLRSDKAVSVALREMTTDRRAENVQLALRCLAQIGEYDDFMPLLRDPTQRYSTWERYLRMLADALDYGPGYAAKVRDSLLRQHGASGEAMYRMLWGYSDEQLRGGAAAYLLETLDHNELDFRVFAIWTLCDITGQPPTTYVPQDQPLKRKAAILKWEQKLKDGQILHKKS